MYCYIAYYHNYFGEKEYLDWLKDLQPTFVEFQLIPGELTFKQTRVFLKFESPVSIENLTFRKESPLHHVNSYEEAEFEKRLRIVKTEKESRIKLKKKEIAELDYFKLGSFFMEYLNEIGKILNSEDEIRVSTIRTYDYPMIRIREFEIGTASTILDGRLQLMIKHHPMYDFENYKFYCWAGDHGISFNVI